MRRPTSSSSLSRLDKNLHQQDDWTRQADPGGRVYYYNRFTATSQWHLPNEFYTSTWDSKLKKAPVKLGKTKSSQKLQMRKTVGSMSTSSSASSLASMMFPGDAKGLRRVDCVTEAWIPQADTDADSKDDQSKEEKLRVLLQEDVLRVCVIGAQNLRDADFSHERWDKSDPYCTCQLDGRPDVLIKTPVMLDNLDPQWHYEDTIERYLIDMGGELIFHVLDYDPQEAGMQMINFTDDKLGKVTLPLEEALTDCLKPKTLKLDDAGSGRDAFLTVEFSPAVAWPELVGMEKTEAARLLRGNRPDLAVELFEPQPPWDDESTFSVTSWDLLLVEKGYDEDFFAVRMKDALDLRKGDTIQVFPDLIFARGRVLGNRRKSKSWTVTHVEPQVTKAPNGDQIAYVFVEGGLGKIIMDNMQWRRLPKAPSKGFQANRVCLYFSPSSQRITSLPRTG